MRVNRRWARATLAFAVAAELLTIGVRGTLASLTSQTTNTGSTGAAGTLTLSTTAGSSTCTSWTGAATANNVNGNCTALPIAAGPWYPGQQTTVTVAVQNTGSEAAGDLSLYMPTCSPGQDANANYIPGFCDGVAFTVQAMSAASGGSALACFYPTVATGACTVQPTNYTDLGQVGEPGTLTDFQANYPTSVQRLALGTLAAGATRYFQLGFYVITASSPSLGNYYQGNTGAMSFVWHLDEQQLPGDGNAP